MAELQQVEKDEIVQGKTVLSFNHPTPKWAVWSFRVEFVINKALMMYLTGTAALQPEKTKEWLLIMGIIDFVVWFAARSVGVKKSEFERLTDDN